MTRIVDYSLALEQAGGSEVLAKDLFTMLLNELPDLYARLESAWQRNDLHDSQECAHKILGSTAYCGVPELANCARTLENALKTGDDESVVATYVKHLGTAVDRLLSHGSALLQEPWC